MTVPLAVDRIFGDRSFAEVGDPVLAAAAERRGLLALAGRHEFGGTAPVGVYGVGDLACHALVRSHYPVHAMAFHERGGRARLQVQQERLAFEEVAAVVAAGADCEQRQRGTSQCFPAGRLSAIPTETASSLPQAPGTRSFSIPTTYPTCCPNSKGTTSAAAVCTAGVD